MDFSINFADDDEDDQEEKDQEEDDQDEDEDEDEAKACWQHQKRGISVLTFRPGCRCRCRCCRMLAVSWGCYIPIHDGYGYGYRNGAGMTECRDEEPEQNCGLPSLQCAGPRVAGI
nr:uncharacterized protein LOC118878394 [Drosophila suzukii]